METEEMKFTFHNKLPTEYDVVTNIMELAPSGQPTEKKETALRKLVLTN